MDLLSKNKIEIMDRKKIPGFKPIEKIAIIKAQESKLSNNIPVYTINAGTQELIRIEFLFSAGMLYEPLPLIASTVNDMLEEGGTKKYNAAQLADLIDNYGAFLETDITQDFSSVCLYTLNKHLKSVLPVMEELIKNSNFPQNELDTYLQNKKQQFSVANKKISNIARKKFNELIFGNKHPYGYNVQIEDYNLIDRAGLIDFFSNAYHSENCKIIISGKVDTSQLALLENHFGKKRLDFKK